MVKQYMERLKEKGYKQTDKREEILRIFVKEKRYLSAKEVLSFMQTVFPELSFDTVYRNLTLFEELEMLETTELNGERIYRLHCSDDEHHHHLICLSCGKSRMIELCPLDALVEKPKEFTITDHKFELYGYCVECS
ncbi:Fur family transcriptional regulator [Pueribacillus sp. YX66]|uniref:Fur family transcriptional regulator n=1 Tax=Pueribacillus sp. YX66 TaxID=3229242 RepID=UPI00358D3F65